MRARSAVIVVGMSLMAALSASWPPPAVATTTSGWIVTLGPGVDPAVEAPTLATLYGVGLGHVYSHVLGGFSFTGTSTAAGLLALDPLVASVVPDGSVQLADAQITPTGVARIGAPSASTAGHTGAGATVAVIDSGVDLVHPDLAANLHPTLTENCITPGLPAQDDNSHGTHVAGIVAARDDAVGVVGVAPAATLVPVKAFDAAGGSTWAAIVCGIDFVAAHADVIDVANMSFGDLSTEATACDGITTSDIDAMRQAICDLVDAGVVPVAAAGNNAVDVSGFVPAAFPEVVTVSALSDTDGQPGGAGGCIVFGAICDDGFAALFSNYGPRIDVMAPGYEILSTMPGGLYGIKDGTSMAAPHVAGVVALLLAADPSLTTSEVRSLLQQNGECPDTSVAGADGACAGQGAWQLDPDGVAEPLVDALGAAQAATDDPPVVSITDPGSASTVAGTVTIAVDASDDRDPAGSLAVDVRVDSGSWQPAAWNVATGRYERSWDTRTTANGSHTIEARATDSGLQITGASVGVTVANGLHSGDLDSTVQPTKRTWKATVTIVVHGEFEQIVAGAVVSFSWSGGTTGSGTCTTNKRGTCSVASGQLANTTATVTLTVTGISKAGSTYTPGTNHDPDGDSDGTTITAVR
jgi:subtilisin